VSRLCSVIFASRTAPPLASVTLPKTSPKIRCANPESGRTAIDARTTAARAPAARKRCHILHLQVGTAAKPGQPVRSAPAGSPLHGFSRRSGETARAFRRGFGSARHFVLSFDADSTRRASSQPAGVVNERVPRFANEPAAVDSPVLGSIHFAL